MLFVILAISLVTSERLILNDIERIRLENIKISPFKYLFKLTYPYYVHYQADIVSNKH